MFIKGSWVQRGMKNAIHAILNAIHTSKNKNLPFLYCFYTLYPFLYHFYF